MSVFFNEAFVRPIFNALVAIYQFIALNDLGIAIIVLTIAIRLLLFPLFHATARYQKLAPKLQKEMVTLRNKYKDDKGAQTKAIMELYKVYKVNPFTPFLSLIIQIPILFALYRVLRETSVYKPAGLIYSFLIAPATLNTTLLGIVDLSKPNVVIILLAAALQYIQAKISLPEYKEGDLIDKAAKMSRNMVFIGPIITLVIFWSLPSALGLYWVAFTAFSIFQQLAVNSQLRKDDRFCATPKRIN